MTLLIPDLHRKNPSSISLASDLCRKWSLWHRGDHLDSLICCKMFPTRHILTDDDIAGALGQLHKECASMTGEDVVELYHFLETHPDLHTNGIRLWQGIKAKARNEREKDEDIKIALAVGRFANNAPTKKV